ncbi:MAG: choice-of-anchor B family protein [Gemmatimonadota bacterium]|nr:choice-of-anchor B family protein [Gemmatimonadota bacterium]
MPIAGLLGAITALCAVAGPALAQDDFGSMVAVSEETVIIGKPGAARGPATLYRYERSATGTWELAGTMSVPGTAAAGQPWSPSLQWRDGRLVVGAGDPDVRFGAHLFRDAGSGGWSHETSLELPDMPTSEESTDREAPAGPAAAAVDFAGIMRILQPALRTVAAQGDRVAVAVGRNGTSPPVVHIFTRHAERGWEPPTMIRFPDLTDDIGTVVLDGDEMFVSSERADGGGAVHVLARDGDQWGPRTPLYPDSTDSSAEFGAAIARAGDRLVVGAPGSGQSTGAVYAFRRGMDGGWERDQVLRPADPGHTEPTPAPEIADSAAPGTRDRPVEPQRFGSSVAILDAELWVGAPGASSGAGQVHRYELRDGGWQQAASVESMAGPGAAFGTTLALGPTVAVAGAPGTDGGSGAAHVFTREPGGEWEAAGAPLRPDDGLEAVTDGEVRCSNGAAAGFACDGVDLLAFLPTSALGGAPGERVSDIWGWTDPATGREYALIGRSGGAAIVDVTYAASPRYMGVVPANPSGARDLKVYADHLFFTGDGAGDHGLVVFDLTRLRDSGPDPVEFSPDAIYRGIASAHNLVLDPESGFAFPVGASGGGQTCGGGLHMVDVRSPKSPVFAGCFTDTEGLIYPGRTHDAQCVVYRGPDDRFQGRELCFASNETALRIIDVTDKEAPVPVGTATYPGLAYVHQGWLTDDQRYYYLDDELDELVGTAPATRTFVFDVAELDDPILVGSVDGPTGATDHNLYVKGDRMYQANYQAGFRLFDISDPEAPVEIGWFDTTPYEGDPPGFVGAWTAYPFFESGTVVVTSMYEGVFLLRPGPRRLIP